MALYSRLLAHQARATDEIHNMLQAYPDGVTVGQLMRDNHERLKDPNSVLAAIDLLVEENKVKREQLGWHENHLDSVKIYPLDQKGARKTNCG